MSDVKNTAVNGQTAPKSRLGVIHEMTVQTLASMTQAELQDPELVESRILTKINIAIALENQNRARGDKWRSLTELLPSQIADILVYSYPIVRIAGAGKNADEDQDLLAVYQYDGEQAGTYVSSSTMMRKLIRRYNYSITIRGAEEVMYAVMEQLPRVTRCQERNLVAVNNGIFDYDTKTLRPFDPSYVFLTKSSVDYVQNPTNPIIHNPDDGTDWDIESWMKDLSDDPEVVNLLWEILGAIIRPLVPWNKSAWFYSETGNNGKGTLCELMRQLCGEQAAVSIPLSDFGKDYMLEPLLRASAIITDENDVGTFIDKAANLKAVITGDMLFINRKYKMPVAFDFHGFMVQCLNELPRIKDRSDSFFRRQLFVPFTKCFTGQERKYIKADYLHRRDVLEYVLWRVLNMDYYTLSEPAACKLALEEYKEFVDPTRQFLADFMPRVKWDLLPFEFMFDLYKAWYKDNAGSERNQKGKPSFLKDIKQLVEADYPAWEVCNSPVRPGTRMNDAEPLILEYHLDKWMNPSYRGNDPDKVCHPALNQSYRGLRRRVPQAGSDEDLLAAVSGDDVSE